MFNSKQIFLYLEDLEQYKNELYCSNCGNDSNSSFFYIRSVTHGQVYFCKVCKEESLKSNKPEEDNY